MNSQKYSVFPSIDIRCVWRSTKERNPVLDRERFFSFASGRAALYQGIKCLYETTGKKIFVPFYHCGVEVEAILRAGFEVVFYPLKDNLDIDINWLENNVGTDVLAILAVHYFGFPQPLVSLLNFCQKNSILLIEDCAHALYSKNEYKFLGEYGDLAIFSFMKTVGIPNGGGVFLNNGLFDIPSKGRKYFHIALVKKMIRSILEYELSRNSATSILASKILEIWERRSTAIDSINEQSNSKLWYYEVPQYHYQHAISSLSSFFLRPLNVERIIKKRRENYFFLLEKINWNKEMQPLFINLEVGVCPLCFPVRVSDNDLIDKKLCGYGITPFIFGRFSHPSFADKNFPQSRSFRRGLIGLPVHQQLNNNAIEEVARRINMLLAEL